jgi:hypothetical protein
MEAENDQNAGNIILNCLSDIDDVLSDTCLMSDTPGTKFPGQESSSASDVTDDKDFASHFASEPVPTLDEFPDLSHSDAPEEVAPLNQDSLPEPDPVQPTDSGPGSLMITEVESPVVIREITIPVIELLAPAFTDEDLKEALDNLFQNGQFPSPELLDPLRVYVRREFMLAVMAQDYDRAEQLKGAETRLADDPSEEQRLAEEQKAREAMLSERISRTKAKLSEIQETWTAKLADFESVINDRTLEMEERHRQEIHEYEARWNDTTTLVAFNKPSSQLIQIRKQQQLSALQGDFNRARDLKRRGDQLEQLETEQAERKARASMHSGYRTMLAKQTKELEVARMNWRRQEQIMVAERDTQLKQANLCLSQLEIRKGELRTGRPRPATPGLARLGNTRKHRATPTTPRTRKKVAEFKEVTSQDKLALMGFRGNDVIRVARHCASPFGNRRSEASSIM